jgi:hypothetical protein
VVVVVVVATKIVLQTAGRKREKVVLSGRGWGKRGNGKGGWASGVE